MTPGRPRGAGARSSRQQQTTDHECGRDRDRVFERNDRSARLERSKCGGELVDTFEPALGIGIDRTFDDAGQPSRHITADCEDVATIATFVGKTQIREVAGAYRVGSGEHAIEQHADAVHIALNRGVAAREETSGARYNGVPASATVEVDDSLISQPVPKSISTARPSVASITFCALMSRCRRPAPWTAETARQIWIPISITSDRLERQTLREPLLDCLAVDQFHPETNGVPDPLGAVNGDDVGMADAREEAAFFDDGGRAGIFDIGPRGQELQRNFAIESSVPGAVHVPEGAMTKWLQDTDVPPDLRRTCR